MLELFFYLLCLKIIFCQLKMNFIKMNTIKWFYVLVVMVIFVILRNWDDFILGLTGGA